MGQISGKIGHFTIIANRGLNLEIYGKTFTIDDLRFTIERINGPCGSAQIRGSKRVSDMKFTDQPKNILVISQMPAIEAIVRKAAEGVAAVAGAAPTPMD